MSALQFYSLFSTNLELPIPSLSVKPEHSVLGPKPGHPSSAALPRVRTYISATRAFGEGLTFMNFQDPPQHNQLDNERKDWENKDFISASNRDSSGTLSTLRASLVDICSSGNSYSWWLNTLFTWPMKPSTSLPLAGRGLFAASPVMTLSLSAFSRFCATIFTRREAIDWWTTHQPPEESQSSLPPGHMFLYSFFCYAEIGQNHH